MVGEVIDLLFDAVERRLPFCVVEERRRFSLELYDTDGGGGRTREGRGMG